MPESEDYNRTLQYAPSAVRVGDVNGDGLDDLVVLSEEGRVALGMTQRSGYPIWGSSPDFVFPTGEQPRSLLIGNLDSDAEVDLAISSARDDWDGSSIALYFQTATGFSNGNATIWTNPNYEASAVASGDFDGDDHADLAVLYPEYSAVGYTMSFSGGMVSIALGYEPAHILTGDLDGDGYADIMVTEDGGGTITLHMGGPAFPDGIEVMQFECEDNITSASIGDLNGDGLLDMAAGTVAGNIEILFNTGDSSLYGSSTVLEVSPGFPVTSFAIDDFNSDGLADIAYPKAVRTIGVIFQKEGPTPISLPADRNLTASFTGWFATVLSGDVTGDSRSDIVALRADDPTLYMFDQTTFGTAGPFDTIELPEAPVFVELMDATDDGSVDLVAIFGSADLLFLYRQENGSLPDAPSMTFVTGAGPNWAMVADATQDHRGDLVVCDSLSHSVSAWEQVNFPPVADAGGPYVTGQGDLLVFEGSADTGASEIPYMEYRWDFGDDNTTGWVRDPNPSHAYMTLGEFAVVMEVRDPAGLNDTDTTTVTVVDSEPHVSFTIQPYPPIEGRTIHFNDTTTSYDDVVLLNWSVDGELVSSGLTTSITAVFDDGPHSVTLEATDSDGSVANHTEQFDVLPSSPDILIVAPTVVDEGAAIPFEVVVDAWNDGPWDPIVAYEWNFSYLGGEFVADEVGVTNATAHVFSAEGDSEAFVVAVRVTDGDGDSSVATCELTVLDIGPDATVTLSVGSPSEGIPFTFVASDSHDGVVAWDWTLTGPGGVLGSFSLTAEEMAEERFVLGDGEYSMRLVVEEADGDTDEHVLDFEVAEIPPEIVLVTSPAASWYVEFQEITFSAVVSSYDPITGFEWDFASSGAEFVPDESTTANVTTHSYAWTGNYTAKVRVTDADGSSAVQSVSVEMRDLELTGSFDDVVVTRADPNATNIVTFDAAFFAQTYPDISNTLWEFGDGDRELVTGPPSQAVVHEYAPVRDYVVNLTLTDDDGNVLKVSRQLLLIQPTIELISPDDDAIVPPGAPLRFSISDDSLPLASVTYSVNEGPPEDFTVLYEIDTSGWADGGYGILVMAEDKDGNIAVYGDIRITIDDTPPSLSVLLTSDHTYAGDRLNVTMKVTDSNIDPHGVVLFIRFPGDDSPMSLLMSRAANDTFYAVVGVPMRTGDLSYWFAVEDLAGNAYTSEPFSLSVRMHFIDAAWPYILALAIASALGVAFYFFRESKIAVDETFVMYSDGRLMAHSTRRLKPGMDDQVLGSMFVAIQDFVRDSFKGETSFTLRKLDFGDKSVMVERGENIYLAVVLHGKVSKKVVTRMKRVIGEIEGKYAVQLFDWDGDLDSVRGVNEMMKKLYSRAPAFPGSLR